MSEEKMPSFENASMKYVVDQHGNLVRNLDQQLNWVKVVKGQHYQVVTSELGTLANDYLASRIGDDLVVAYADGVTLVFLDYFSMPINGDMQSEESTSVTLAGTSEPYVVTAGAGIDEKEVFQVRRDGGDFMPLLPEPSASESALAQLVEGGDAGDMALAAELEARSEPAVGAAVGLYTLLGGGVAIAAAAGGSSTSATSVATAGTDEAAQTQAWQKVQTGLNDEDASVQLTADDINALKLNGLNDLPSRNLLNSFLNSAEPQQVDSYEKLVASAAAVTKLAELVASQDSEKPLTLDDVNNLTVADIDTQNELDFLKTVLASKSPIDVDSIAEIQVLANAVEQIKNAPEAVTRAQLEALGIAGINSVNLGKVKEKVAAIGADVNSLADLQAQLSEVQNTVAGIIADLVAATHGEPLLKLDKYSQAGFTGVNASNLQLIGSVWELENHGAPQSTASGQTLLQTQASWLQTYITELAKIYLMVGEPTFSESVSLSQIHYFGLLGVNDDGAALWNAVVKNRQGLEPLAANLIDVLSAAHQLSNLSGAGPEVENTLTFDEFKILGFTNIDSEGKADFLSNVLKSKEFEFADPWLQIQKLDVAVEHWFSSKTGVSDPLSVVDLGHLGLGAGVYGGDSYTVTEDNLAAVQGAVDVNVNANPNITMVELIAFIGTAAWNANNALLFLGDRAADDNAATTGLTNIKPHMANLQLYNPLSEEQVSSFASLLNTTDIDKVHVDSWQEVQALGIVATMLSVNSGESIGDQAVVADHVKVRQKLMLTADVLSKKSLDDMFNTDLQAAVKVAADKALDLVAWDLEDGSLAETIDQSLLLSLSELATLGIEDATTGADVAAYNTALVGLANSSWEEANSLLKLDALFDPAVVI